jgi:hypothetical protein
LRFRAAATAGRTSLDTLQRRDAACAAPNRYLAAGSMPGA